MEHMRYSADWMVLADDRILEYIREMDSGGATKMANSGYVRYSRQYISQRLNKLADKGFLRHLGNGVYVLTDRGEAYLEGDLDAETLEEPENGFGRAQS